MAENSWLCDKFRAFRHEAETQVWQRSDPKLAASRIFPVDLLLERLQAL